MGFEKSVIFNCGAEDYAVPVEQVISIEKVEQVTPIPHLPNYLKGLTRVRNELIPVIDFQQILYGRRSEGENIRMIVLNTNVVNYGLVVSDAKEILDIAPQQIVQMGLMNYARTKYFTAVANLDERIITCVDPQVLVQSLEGVPEILSYLEEMSQNQTV